MSFESHLRITIDSKSGEARLKALEGQLDRAQGSGERLAEGMSVLKIALGAAATAAGGFSVGKIVTETAAFEQSLLKLQVVSGATTSQLAAMEDQARTLGATSMFSARQAADAQNFLAMAGMNVNEVLSATPGILQLATAGQMDLASAADLASNVLGGFQMKVGELNRVNDVLAATAAKSNTSIAQLGDALSYAAPLAATAGVSIEETAAAIGVLSDAGLQSSRAGTGLLGFIRQLSNLTPNATAALSGYGLTAAEVNIEQEGLIAVLDRLQQANINTADSFKIFGAEAGPAANILAAGAVRVNEFTGVLELAEGTAAKAALTLGSGLEGAMLSLGSAVGESTLQLGRDSGMSGALQEVIGSATGVISVYNGMLPQFQEANQLTDEQARNLENIATTVSLTTGAVGGLTAAYVSLTAATWAAHAAQTALLRIMRANPILLAAGAVATLSGALYTARNRTIEFGDTQATVLDWMNGAWSASAEVFSENWDGAVTSAIGMFEAMAEPVGGVANYLWGTFQSLMTNLGNITKNTTNAIIAYFNTIGDVMAIVADAIWNQYANAFDKTLNLARGFWQDLEAVFSGDFSFGNFQAALNTEIVDPLAGAASRIQAAFDENLSTDYVGDVFGAIGEGAQFVAADFTALGERISDAAFQARMARNGFGLVAEGFSEGKTQSQLLQEQLDKLNQSLADPASEEAAKAAKTLADNFESLKRTLDPSYSSLMDFWEGIELLNKAIDTTTVEGMTEYNRLVGKLTERYAEATKGSDDAKKAMERLTQQYDSAHSRAQQLTTDLAAINQAWRNDPSNGDQYARMIASIRDEMQQLALEADPMAQEMARAWEEATNRIDETFSDAFAGAFDSFDSFADSLLDGFKRLLAELAYQATLKPIVVGFTGDMQSIMSGGGGGFGNTISAARGVMKGSSLFGGGSTAAAAGGLYSSASTGLAAGGLYGNAVTGGVASTGLMSSITSGISAAMPWLAGGALVDNVLGLGITDGITKALSGLFGSDRKSYGQIGSQIGGDTNAGDGVYRYDRNDRSMGWAQQTALGTIGVTKKQKTDDDALIEMVAGLAQFDNTLASVMTAAQLEQTRTALDGWKSSRTENIGGLVDERLSAVMNATKSVFTDVLSQFEGEALVQGLVGGLQIENVGAQMATAVAADMNAEFREALGGGSDVQAATQSILSSAQAVQTLGGAVDRLNLQFDATAAGALGAAGNLANLVGGTDNLNSLLSGYYDAFYTEQEKFDNLASDLRGTFADMGRELPTTREGVRSVVESLQLMGEAGQEQLATILQLNQPLSQYIAAMEAQKAAAEKSAQAERELAAQRSLSLSYGALAGIDGALDDYNAAVSLSETLASERRSQLDDELRAVEQLRGLVDSLMLSNQSILDPMERMQESQRQLAELQARAEGGDTAAVGQLQGASTAYLDAAAAYYGQSSSQYAAIFGDVTSSVSSLEQQYGDSADTLGSIEGIEQQMLREQQRARDLLMSQLNAQIDAAAGITSLAGLLGELPSSIADALSGIITTQGRYGAVTSEGEYVSDAGFNDTQRAINDIYNDALGRNAETEGLDYWADQISSGKSIDRIREEIENAAVHGAHADGLGTVPFDGYTARLHKGETVLPAPLAQVYRDSAPGSSSSDVVAELKVANMRLQRMEMEITQLRSERRMDAERASNLSSKQLGEQKKINKNVKLKERVS